MTEMKKVKRSLRRSCLIVSSSNLRLRRELIGKTSLELGLMGTMMMNRVVGRKGLKSARRDPARRSRLNMSSSGRTSQDVLLPLRRFQRVAVVQSVPSMTHRAAVAKV